MEKPLQIFKYKIKIFSKFLLVKSNQEVDNLQQSYLVYVCVFVTKQVYIIEIKEKEKTNK